MIFSNPDGPRVKATLAKAEAEGRRLQMGSVDPVLETSQTQAFTAGQASAVTGKTNARLTVGEEADAEPLIKRR